MPGITWPRRGIAALLTASMCWSAGPAIAQYQYENLPRLGEAAGDELSSGTERRIGEAIMRDLRRERQILDDVELAEWLNRFGAQIAEAPAAAGYSFEFFFVPDPSLNAFAMPGGFIGVHTGLVVAAQSESELASVLAHEIGHVTQRHIARMLSQQRQSSVLSLAALVLAALAARSNPQGAAGLATLGSSVQQQMMLGFSRDAEREADRVGIDILRQSGFEANGMVMFFGRLQQAGRLYENNAPAYLRTHPLTTERISDMQLRIRDSRYRQRPDSLEFHLVRAKLRATADSSVDGLKRIRAEFERAIKERTAVNEAAAWYGLSVVSNAQRDFMGAERALGEARRRVPAGHAFFERLSAEIRLANDDPKGALAVAEAASSRFPASRALVHMRARTMLAAGEPQRAATFLADQVKLYASDAELWQLLSQAYGALDQPALAHRAAAEQYALTGGWLAAIEQLRLAQRSGKLDFYTASQVDARMKDLQAEYRREREERAQGR